MSTPERLARWREEYRQLSSVIADGTDKMQNWVDNATLYRPDGDDAGACLVTIRALAERYRALVAHLPDVDDFTDLELEKREGKVEQFLRIALATEPLLRSIECCLEKLNFLCTYPSQ
jgi:hypothetical protein